MKSFLGLIKSVMNICGLVSVLEFWQVIDHQSPIPGISFTTFNDIVLTTETLYNLFSLPQIHRSWQSSR